ncbi:hypothetical protein Trydic_g18764 [Trypoxylus dichotomus]
MDKDKQLAKFVISNRKIPHTVNSLNDTKNTIVHTEEKIRNFQREERVHVRDYILEFGKINRTPGKLHYLIQLDDGRLWKKHVEQIRSMGEMTVNIDGTRSYENFVISHPSR